MKMKTISSAAALCLAMTMLAGCAGNSGNGEKPEDSAAPAQTEALSESTPPEADPAEEEKLKGMTSLEMIRAMGNGINLGNTLEAYNHQSYTGGSNPDGFETGWGQPYTTAEMIQGMKNAGFDTI
ncbi:MAG: hypothetical protein J6K92_04300, partial [Oscillospiraceae bacterium]|nr:hypothetical protein [Oscillospiraceae bacterium]